jgi:putative Holliday junction resolvase
MGRILCIDYGRKRIGLAISDESNRFALPLRTLEYSNLQENINSIIKLVEEFNIERIVIGLPREPATGKITSLGKEIESFAKVLSGLCDREVVFCDEWYTTKQAESVLIEADISRKKRRKYIDALSAVLILQSFLDSKQQNK